MGVIKESKLKNGTLTLGGTSFATQASNVSLKPDVKEVGESVETLDGSTLLAGETTSWALHIEAVQDFADSAGFVNYCTQQAGNVVSFSWKPTTGTLVPTYTGTAKVRATEIGGDVNVRLTTSVDFPVQTGPVTAYA